MNVAGVLLRIMAGIQQLPSVCMRLKMRIAGDWFPITERKRKKKIKKLMFAGHQGAAEGMGGIRDARERRDEGETEVGQRGGPFIFQS